MFVNMNIIPFGICAKLLVSEYMKFPSVDNPILLRFLSNNYNFGILQIQVYSLKYKFSVYNTL